MAQASATLVAGHGGPRGYPISLGAVEEEATQAIPLEIDDLD
jgi:hypothetical protein